MVDATTFPARSIESSSSSVSSSVLLGSLNWMSKAITFAPSFFSRSTTSAWMSCVNGQRSSPNALKV